MSFKKYGLPAFEDLEPSTETVMIYTNLSFDLSEIFKSIPIYNLDAPLTKKQKNVDKKKLDSPYGTVVSVQSITQIRGLDLRKKKKKWCTVCQPYEVARDSGKETKILTINEFLEKDTESDVNHIKYYCTKCQKIYNPREIRKITYFLNQLTIVISIGKHPLLNVMMFKDNFKIVGCKDIDDAVEAIMILWQDYILPHTHLWKFENPTQSNVPRFQFELVMKNLGFCFGFPIDKYKLNTLMNQEKYSDKIFMSQYESTGQINVNIKMFSVKPKNYTYECLVIPLDKRISPYFVKVPALTYRKDKKKKKEKFVTFIVFSSSETILTGRYDENMKEMYEFFVNLVIRNRKLLEEKIDE